MKKLLVELNSLSKVYVLEEYGRITFVDDFVNVVFLEVHSDEISSILKLPFVLNVEENGNGSLLAV